MVTVHDDDRARFVDVARVGAKTLDSIANAVADGADWKRIVDLCANAQLVLVTMREGAEQRGRVERAAEHPRTEQDFQDFAEAGRVGWISALSRRMENPNAKIGPVLFSALDECSDDVVRGALAWLSSELIGQWFTEFENAKAAAAGGDVR